MSTFTKTESLGNERAQSRENHRYASVPHKDLLQTPESARSDNGPLTLEEVSKEEYRTVPNADPEVPRNLHSQIVEEIDYLSRKYLHICKY